MVEELIGRVYVFQRQISGCLVVLGRVRRTAQGGQLRVKKFRRERAGKCLHGFALFGSKGGEAFRGTSQFSFADGLG
jgi:hypothetical protein